MQSLGAIEAMSIDVGQMVATLVDFYSVSADSAEPHAPKVVCQPHEDNMIIMGVEVRLVQVFTKSDRQCAFVLAAGRRCKHCDGCERFPHSPGYRR